MSSTTFFSSEEDVESAESAESAGKDFDLESDLTSISTIVDDEFFVEAISPFEFFCRLLLSSSFGERGGDKCLGARRLRFPRRLVVVVVVLL